MHEVLLLESGSKPLLLPWNQPDTGSSRPMGCSFWTKLWSFLNANECLSSVLLSHTLSFAPVHSDLPSVFPSVEGYNTRMSTSATSQYCTVLHIIERPSILVSVFFCVEPGGNSVCPLAENYLSILVRDDDRMLNLLCFILFSFSALLRSSKSLLPRVLTNFLGSLLLDLVNLHLKG